MLRRLVETTRLATRRSQIWVVCLTALLPTACLGAPVVKSYAWGSQSSNKATIEQSASNLKQIAMGLLMYAQDYDDKLPSMRQAQSMAQIKFPLSKNSKPTVQQLLLVYVKDAEIFAQPVTHAIYRANPVLSGRLVEKFKDSASVVAFYEAAPSFDKKRAVLFLNGNVKRVTELEWRTVQKVSEAQTGFPKPTLRASPQTARRLVASDYEVLNAVFRHFAALKSDSLRMDGDRVLLNIKTPEKSGHLERTQIECDLGVKGPMLSDQLLKSLQARNKGQVSVAALKGRDSQIVIEDFDNFPTNTPYGSEFEDSIKRKHKRIRAYATTWLPGYSADNTKAVVCFWFGPSAHGATASYLLVKKAGHWKVQWHNLAWYA